MVAVKSFLRRVASMSSARAVPGWLSGNAESQRAMAQALRVCAAQSASPTGSVVACAFPALSVTTRGLAGGWGPSSLLSGAAAAAARGPPAAGHGGAGGPCQVAARRSKSSATPDALDDEFDILSPFLSDQVPIPDGVIGDVEEVCVEVGDVVGEGEVVVIVETHKASINIKAAGAPFMKVTQILVSEGDELKESVPVIRVAPS